MKQVRKSTPRCDTARNQEFVTTSLGPLVSTLLTINTHHAPEAYCEKLNAEADENPLYYDFQITSGRARVSVSTSALKAKWGRVAVAIWEKLFIRVVRGGHAHNFVTDTGVTFNSVWELNMPNWQSVTLKGAKSLSSGKLKPSELLAIIDSLDSIVVATTEWINVKNPMDPRHVVTVPAKRERVTREKATELSKTVRKEQVAKAWSMTKQNYSTEKNVGQYKLGE